MSDMVCLACGRMWSEHTVAPDASRAYCPVPLEAAREERSEPTP